MQKQIRCKICGQTFFGYKNRKYCSSCKKDGHKMSKRKWAVKNFGEYIKSWVSENPQKNREIQKRGQRKYLSDDENRQKSRIRSQFWRMVCNREVENPEMCQNCKRKKSWRWLHISFEPHRAVKLCRKCWINKVKKGKKLKCC